jgi:deoxyribodipyrimidine photo-lyase
VLLWFRDDLRLADHAALCAAAAAGAPLFACYVLDEAGGAGVAGAASRWWLHGSLVALQRQIAERRGTLLLRRGSAARVLAELVEATGAEHVHCSKSYDPAGRATEDEVRRQLARRAALLTVHAGRLLFDPEQIRTGTGGPFKVFTAFWKACLAAEPPGPPRRVPTGLRFARAALETDELKDWRLSPGAPDWAAGLRERWSPGEDAARAGFDAFLAAGLEHYPGGRNRPDRAGTSRLSPHLHYGELSPRSVWAAVRRAGADPRRSAGAAALLRELGWREFAQHLLWHWPDFATTSFRPQFRRFPWRDDPEALASWQRGRTGYPLVDAGMRELWHTGWMHNRVRMVAGSFLVKHLLIPWQRGAAWFWDTLVDADLANNAAGWQWVAGSGADAAPYFRVFNPVLQAKRFDPEGDYIRQWVPELARLPVPFIHEPSAAPVEVLRAARVDLGSSYPLPIVEHRAGRARALAAYASVKAARGSARRQI